MLLKKYCVVAILYVRDCRKTKEENEATSRGNLSKGILSANYKVSLNFNRTLIIFSKTKEDAFLDTLFKAIVPYASVQRECRVVRGI